MQLIVVQSLASVEGTVKASQKHSIRFNGNCAILLASDHVCLCLCLVSAQWPALGAHAEAGPVVVVSCVAHASRNCTLSVVPFLWT